jgi:hypothetical protein
MKALEQYFALWCKWWAEMVMQLNFDIKYFIFLSLEAENVLQWIL